MMKVMAIIAAAVGAAAAATVLASSVLFFILFRQEAIPRPVCLPFESWDEAGVLPPFETAEYQVTVQYERKQGGRLGEPLRITLFDETVGKTVAIEGEPIFWETETRIGKCHLSAGHRYRVEVDADQVKELGLHHHRLEIDVSLAEATRRSQLLP